MPAAPAAETAAHAGVLINGRRIGPAAPAYIVAEAGVNHDGNPDSAFALIDAAALAGADAVKFQVFRAAELATAGAETAAYQQASGGMSQRQMLARLELEDVTLAALHAHCISRGVEFLATPFSPPDVPRLQALQVAAYKVASTDLNNTPLLRAIAATGNPLIVSTGAATVDEIRTAVIRLRSLGCGERLILLHCVSCYPTPLEAANLRAIETLRKTFNAPAGFSDHTLSLETGAWAVAIGACVLEKHFTLDRSASGPDHAMSLAPTELAAYIARVRDAERALGAGVLGMQALEQEVRCVARKSVVTATALPAGATLTPGMLTTKRPGGGISPDCLDALIGRSVRFDTPADTVLTWDMLI